jgi:hypothetical protein
VTTAVVDPSVLVSAFLGRPDAAPGRLVSAWRDGHFTMIVCPLLLDELADVLARPKFERWASGDCGLAYVPRSPHAAITDPILRISRTRRTTISWRSPV